MCGIVSSKLYFHFKKALHTYFSHITHFSEKLHFGALLTEILSYIDICRIKCQYLNTTRWHAGFIVVCACCIAVLSVIGIQLCHIGLSCSKQRQAMNWIPLLFFAEFNWFNLISTWIRCHFASPSGVHMAVLQHGKQHKLWNLHLILALMVMHGHPFIDDRISAY